jgi:hypothetical protein
VAEIRSLWTGILPGEPEFANRPLGPQTVRKVQPDRSGGLNHGRKASGLVEAEARANLAGSCAENPAACGRIERSKPLELNGDLSRRLSRSSADRSPPSPDRLAGKQDLGKKLRDRTLPVGLIVSGEVGKVGEGLVDTRVKFPHKRHKLVTDAVPRVDRLSIGRVSSPRLVGVSKEGLDLCTAHIQQRTNDLACFVRDHRVNRTEPLRPSTPQQLQEDGFGLIVQRVSGQDGVGLTRGEQTLQKGIAKIAGGFLGRFARLLDPLGNAGAVNVKVDIEALTKGLHERKIVICLNSPKAVVNVSGREPDAEVVLGTMERKQEGYGVGPARDGHADAVAREEVFAVQRERHSASLDGAAGHRASQPIVQVDR